jgi:hypothetical protein
MNIDILFFKYEFCLPFEVNISSQGGIWIIA